MTSSPSGGLVGRDTGSTAAIRYMSAVYILRDGQDVVASITKHTQAKTGVSEGNILQVSGHISGNTGSLQVSWKYPTDVQSGDYVCEASGLSSLGKSLTITKSLTVGISNPNITDLIKHISGLKLDTDKHQQDISDQKVEDFK